MPAKPRVLSAPSQCNQKNPHITCKTTQAQPLSKLSNRRLRWWWAGTTLLSTLVLISSASTASVIQLLSCVESLSVSLNTTFLLRSKFRFLLTIYCAVSAGYFNLLRSKLYVELIFLHKIRDFAGGLNKVLTPVTLAFSLPFLPSNQTNRVRFGPTPAGRARNDSDVVWVL